MTRALSLVVAAIVVVIAGPVQAFQRETTHDPPCIERPGINCPHLGTPLFWSARPVLFFVNSDNSGSRFDAITPAIQAAFTTWQSASSDGITFEFAGQSHGGTNGQDGQNTISWRNLTNTTDTFAQSIITFDTKSGVIVDVDVELNANFHFAVLPAGEDDRADPNVDIQAVLTHEAGHLLGLDHENRFGPGVVMFFEDTSGNTMHRSLTSDDQDGVRAAYPTSGGHSGGGGGGGCVLVPGGDGFAPWPVALLLLWLAIRARGRRELRPPVKY